MKKQKNKIIQADYYTVQLEVDGFGNDTFIVFSSNTFEDCMNFIKKGHPFYELDGAVIVPQYFNKEFKNKWTD